MAFRNLIINFTLRYYWIFIVSTANGTEGMCRESHENTLEIPNDISQ